MRTKIVVKNVSCNFIVGHLDFKSKSYWGLTVRSYVTTINLMVVMKVCR